MEGTIITFPSSDEESLGVKNNMQIEKINKQSIKKAVDLLSYGGIVVFPTETAYGMGCDATNTASIAKIFKIKKRLKSNNLPIICATKKQVKQFFEFSKKAEDLAKKYWPGPLSLVLSTRTQKQKSTKLYSYEVPVRISSNKTARALVRGLKKPIIATSANISGNDTLYNSQEIFDSFKNKKYKPDLILDGGRLKKNKPSTIVAIEGDEILIKRQGDIKI